MSTNQRRWALSAISCLLLTAILEITFRALPTDQMADLAVINAATPVARYTANTEWFHSDTYDFRRRVHGRTNNAGFNNNVDYHADEEEALVAIVGDSYIDAKMVPFEETCHGRLQELLRDEARVYSFGIGGAPMSQYLIWAREARRYGATGMVFVAVDNDYDESIYRPAAERWHGGTGFHYFHKDGELLLDKADWHEPGWWWSTLRESALLRYIAINLNGLGRARRAHHEWTRDEDPEPTPDDINDRTSRAMQAMDWFLAQAPLYSGLKRREIIIVVDGRRTEIYPVDGMHSANEQSWRNRTQELFARKAAEAGYHTIDLHDAFLERHEVEGIRFEWHDDYHWNEDGHRVCFEELRKVLTDQS